MYDDIRNAQIQLCDDSANCYLLSNQFETMLERGMMKDQYHYTQEGYNLVGNEAGRKAGDFSNMIPE